MANESIKAEGTKADPPVATVISNPPTATAVPLSPSGAGIPPGAYVVEIQTGAGQVAGLLPVYKVAQWVKLFAMLDLLGIVLNAILGGFTPTLVGLIFPMLGYWGAACYNQCCLLAWGIFQLLEVVVRFLFLYASASSYGDFSISIVWLFVSFYIMKITFQLRQAVVHLSKEDLQFLKGNRPLFKKLNRGC